MLSEFLVKGPAVFKNQKRSDLQISNSNYAVIEDGEKRTSLRVSIEEGFLLELVGEWGQEEEIDRHKGPIL